MSDFDAFLADLDRLEGCQRTKARVRGLLSRYSGRLLYISRSAILSQDRQALVRKLEAQPGVTRAEIVRALANRWGVTPRMARIWLSRAHAENSI